MKKVPANAAEASAAETRSRKARAAKLRSAARRLGKRAAAVLQDEIERALELAADDPHVRDYSDAACYALGRIEGLLRLSAGGPMLETFKLFEVLRHNARTRARLDELAEEGLSPADLIDDQLLAIETAGKLIRRFEALRHGALVTCDDRQVELFK